MKKFILMTLALALIIGSCFALQVTTGTQYQLPGDTAILIGSSETSGYLQTGGSEDYIMTTGTQPTRITAEVLWHYNTGSTVLSTETITVGTIGTVKSNRCRIRIYSAGNQACTPEAIWYAY